VLSCEQNRKAHPHARAEVRDEAAVPPRVPGLKRAPPPSFLRVSCASSATTTSSQPSSHTRSPTTPCVTSTASSRTRSSVGCLAQSWTSPRRPRASGPTSRGPGRRWGQPRSPRTSNARPTMRACISWRAQGVRWNARQTCGGGWRVRTLPVSCLPARIPRPPSGSFDSMRPWPRSHASTVRRLPFDPGPSLRGALRTPDDHRRRCGIERVHRAAHLRRRRATGRRWLSRHLWPEPLVRVTP
jgi:hypothetical protein